MAYEDDHFIDTTQSVWNYSVFNNSIISEFQSGLLSTAYQYFGCKLLTILEKTGYYFAVWAPNAKAVSVVGDFNQWDPAHHPLRPRLDHSGIWEGFIPHFSKGSIYKYHITSIQNQVFLKADPYAHFSELRPNTASVAWNFEYDWKDNDWMNHRKKFNALYAPWNVYELHLGSWMRPDKHNENSFNSYKQIAELLVPYVLEMGFTHVELMPIMEFPYDKSWGYQCTGYFAATSRFGIPEDLMFLIDTLHQNGIGVILDWVPSHFPADAHGLYLFDGAHTYEYADMRKGFHPDWNSYIFNYKRGEVCSFLLSSAHFWLQQFHADGLRVDAVNSIIRLDFSRKDGEWEPNEYGNNANIEAIAFIRSLNQMVYAQFPDVQTIAEEASDWPGITTPINEGGFGFGMKWMMGWMHDTFRYFKTAHHHRQHKQDTFSFSMMYFYDEKFMLPLSHDEVVHGKSPMLYKMPGFEYEKFANLRLLYGYMYTHPGAKLLFMGNEFGQSSEWNESSELDWGLLQHDSHKKLQSFVKALSHLYKSIPSLFEYQFESQGFEWIELNRRGDGVMAYRRKGKDVKDDLLIIVNTSEKKYQNWSMQISGKTQWKELLNSNAIEFWGTGELLNENIAIKIINKKNTLCEINFDIPALSILIFR
jgi:1,4-alpha-glucan branching enzyme